MREGIIYYVDTPWFDYNVIQIIEKAKERGYAIRLAFMEGYYPYICEKLPDSCLGLGTITHEDAESWEYINVESNDDSWDSSPKRIAFEKNVILIIVEEANYRFSVRNYKGNTPHQSFIGFAPQKKYQNRKQPL